jgi:hypothetical protein
LSKEKVLNLIALIKLITGGYLKMSKNNLNSKKSNNQNTNNEIADIESENNQKDKPPSFASTIEQKIAIKSNIGISENDKK